MRFKKHSMPVHRHAAEAENISIDEEKPMRILEGSVSAIYSLGRQKIVYNAIYNTWLCSCCRYYNNLQVPCAHVAAVQDFVSTNKQEQGLITSRIENASELLQMETKSRRSRRYEELFQLAEWAIDR